MAKKFNVYDALKSEGFTETINQFGGVELSRTFEKEVEVAWYGESTQQFTIVALFNPEKTVVRAYYYNRGNSFNAPFKAKTHLNDKRAYNAIHETARNNGFAF